MGLIPPPKKDTKTKYKWLLPPMPYLQVHRMLQMHVRHLALKRAVGQLQSVVEVPALNGVVDGLQSTHEKKGFHEGN